MNSNEKKLENFLNKEPLFKIEGYNNHHKNISSFIKSFTNGELNKKRTLYLNNKQQCMSNKARSILDLLIVCKYHHPEWKIKDIVKIIKKLYDNNETKGHYCTSINKIVMIVNHPYWSNYIQLDTYLSNKFPMKIYEFFKILENDKV